MSGEAVSDNYFALLGIHAARGRTFLGQGNPDDEGGVVLSQLGWQRLANSEDDIVGRTISKKLGGRLGQPADAFPAG